MDVSGGSHEFEYEEIDQRSDQELDLLYAEVQKKVEGQVSLNNRIEDQARSGVKTIFITFGLFLSVLSISIPFAASTEMGTWELVVSRINGLYFTLVNSGTFSGMDAGLLVIFLTISSIGYFATFFGQLFLVALYCNMSAARTSLVKSSISTTRLQDRIHDDLSMNQPKRCLLYDYADVIALNNGILQRKWVDKKAADKYTILAFWNLFWCFLVIYLAFVSLKPVLVIFAGILTAFIIIYRVFKLLGYFQNRSIGEIIYNLASKR